MNATELWQLSPEQFNEWRRENDYPHIWDLLVVSLPYFGDWMADQKIDKGVIFQIGMARFISSRCVLSLCVYMSDDKTRLYETASSALESLRKSGLIRSEVRFEPYLMWLTGKYGKEAAKRVQSLLSVSENNKGEAQVLGKHSLLNIGGVELKSPIISGRLLDFTCLDELSLDGAINNSKVYLWHCSAKGVRVNGGVIGLDLFDSLLWDHRAWAKKRELALEDGVFQDFTIECEEIRFHSSRAVLKNFNVRAKSFDATMEHTNLDKVQVVYNENGRIDHSEASKLYRNAKRIFSSVGDTVDAGDAYYQEKLHEMKSLASPRELFKESWLRSGPLKKGMLSLLCYLKCASKFISFITWGFGERPIRSLLMSMVVILLATLTYFLAPESVTHGHLGRSLYFSIVTFVTLGYGDISQTSSPLQLLSAIEAFSGMFLTGLFLAGFASKTKQY
ncbi:MAG: potassium channel family protein [Aeromonas sp.]|uniref:potassium channel family protein n=1 Tax=Aeromonas sp. TaxID=647 RepID=UPI002FC96CA5